MFLGGAGRAAWGARVSGAHGAGPNRPSAVLLPARQLHGSFAIYSPCCRRVRHRFGIPTRRKKCRFRTRLASRSGWTCGEWCRFGASSGPRYLASSYVRRSGGVLCGLRGQPAPRGVSRRAWALSGLSAPRQADSRPGRLWSTRPVGFTFTIVTAPGAVDQRDVRDGEPARRPPPPPGNGWATIQQTAGAKSACSVRRGRP